MLMEYFKELEARLTITIVCLLSLIAYNFVIDADLPKLEYLTIMDYIILVSYIYINFLILFIYTYIFFYYTFNIYHVSTKNQCGRSSGVERNLAKVEVEGSNPFARSKNKVIPQKKDISFNTVLKIINFDL